MSKIIALINEFTTIPNSCSVCKYVNTDYDKPTCDITSDTIPYGSYNDRRLQNCPLKLLPDKKDEKK